MNDKLPITVILAVKNEEVNIPKCLAALKIVKKVYLVDSQSKDRTCELAEEVDVEVVQFLYQGGYPKKRQWAIEKLSIRTPWILLLDADEVVPDKLWQEIKLAVNNSHTKNAYFITKGFHFLGKAFRYGGFSHSAVILFKKGKVKFEHIIDEPPTAPDSETHERLIVEGSVGYLKTPLIHEDYKGLEVYIARHNNYSTWEAKVRYQYLETDAWGDCAINAKLFGNAQERRRYLKVIAMKIPFEPTLWFIYHYLIRLGFLEGRPGLIASQIRASYIAQAKAKLYELKIVSGKHF